MYERTTFPVTMPFGYVSPEQSMKDRADYARKGIARGGSVVVMRFNDGILLVAENRSPALHKVSEIYDRIAFAAVGKYNEFENLRIAGIRIADLRGYGYDRRDVTARSLANAYAQALGTIFTTEPKPYEVEILVAEVGDTSDRDQIYRLTYDGSIADERGFAVMGGLADQVSQNLSRGYQDGLTLGAALRLALSALSGQGEQARTIEPEQLEVAVLERSRPRARKFSRIGRPRLVALLDESQPDSDGGADAAPVGAGVDELAPNAPPPGASTFTDIQHDRPGNASS